MGFRGGRWLPAASALSGGPVGHAPEERELEGTTQSPPLGRPRTELVFKHVSIFSDWPVLLLGTMWVQSWGSCVLVREGFCSRLGAAGRPPPTPYLLPLALVHSVCLTASRIFLSISELLKQHGVAPDPPVLGRLFDAVMSTAQSVERSSEKGPR